MKILIDHRTLWDSWSCCAIVCWWYDQNILTVSQWRQGICLWRVDIGKSLPVMGILEGLSHIRVLSEGDEKRWEALENEGFGCSESRDVK